MAVDRWFIGGGAEHTPEAARRALYASTAGAEGVGQPNDLKVLPLAVPGQGVRVAIGSALMKSMYVGGETQSYMGTVTSQETVSVTPTGSTGGRTDLVILQIEDPFAAGSTTSPPPAAQIPNAPYVRVRVISGVPANTRKVQDIAAYKNITAVTLARISFPPSTGTVTAAMIADLRKVAMPRRSEVVFARPRVAADEGAQTALTKTAASGGEYYPGGAGFANQFSVEIPEWATRMVIDARWMSNHYANNPYGSFWVEYGDEYREHTWPNKQQYEFATQQFAFNSPNTTDEKTADWNLMDEVGIAAKLRGKIVTFVFKAGKTATASHRVWMNSYGGLGMRITFAERAIDSDLL